MLGRLPRRQFWGWILPLNLPLAGQFRGLVS